VVITVGGFWFSDDIAYAEGLMVSPFSATKPVSVVCADGRVGSSSGQGGYLSF
jgi:hypothetical protein